MMWGGKKILNLLAKLLLVFCLLLSLAGYTWSTEPENVILTRDEYTAVMNSLEISKAELKQAQQEIKLLKNTLEKQEAILTVQSNLLTTLKPFWSEQKNALKSKYFEGLFTGLLVGIPLGAAAGAWGGFSLGVRVAIP